MAPQLTNYKQIKPKTSNNQAIQPQKHQQQFVNQLSVGHQATSNPIFNILQLPNGIYQIFDILNVPNDKPLVRLIQLPQIDQLQTNQQIIIVNNQANSNLVDNQSNCSPNSLGSVGSNSPYPESRCSTGANSLGSVGSNSPYPESLCSDRFSSVGMSSPHTESRCSGGANSVDLGSPYSVNQSKFIE